MSVLSLKYIYLKEGSTAQPLEDSNCQKQFFPPGMMEVCLSSPKRIYSLHCGAEGTSGFQAPHSHMPHWFYHPTASCFATLTRGCELLTARPKHTALERHMERSRLHKWTARSTCGMGRLRVTSLKAGPGVLPELQVTIERSSLG